MIVRTLLLSGACLAGLLAVFFMEKLSLDRCRRRIPRRVAVTGTRGKSSVTRLVAAALRASGARVLARTTGSLPVVIFPDGSEREVTRSGPPTLLEGKRLLRTARRLKADTVVAELMSIGPEYLEAESRGLFRPTILAVTNVRLDHEEAMGRTRAEVGRSLASAVPARATVFMLREEVEPSVAEMAERLGSRLVAVPAESEPGPSRGRTTKRTWDFSGNTRLALAVARSCGVGKRTALKAMASARPDPGAFRLWSVRAGQPPRAWTCASGFAANEPESTSLLLDRLRAAGLLGKGPRLALLSLRQDRPDRTRQWLAAWSNGFFRDFEEIFVAGVRPSLLPSGKIIRSAESPRLTCMKTQEPRAMMDRMVSGHRSGGLIFGAGNIGGIGLAMAAHWEREGKARA